jgi:hypothetical protein
MNAIAALESRKRKLEEMKEILEGFKQLRCEFNKKNIDCIAKSQARKEQTLQTLTQLMQF